MDGCMREINDTEPTQLYNEPNSAAVMAFTHK
jgi:hypothetical protein